ncbi:hypothetical protein BDY24DRAFT_400452 [Mrakia frigida]|uniref:uncharacterized protein n=1 Tax=Mrakia frigida TaxID=29902 RepID=UPI003FCC149C
MASTGSLIARPLNIDDLDNCSGAESITLEDEEVVMRFSVGSFDVEFEQGVNENLFVSAFIATFKTNTAKLDLGTVGDELGEAGFRQLLREIGKRSRMLRFVEVQAFRREMNAYVLPLLLPFLSSLPNLQEIRIRSTFRLSSIGYLLSIAQHPTLRHLNLAYCTFKNRTLLDLLTFLLIHFTTNSNLNRLTLDLRCPSSVTECAEALLIQIIEQGRESSLEYVRVDQRMEEARNFVSDLETFFTFVDRVQEGNKTIQGIWTSRSKKRHHQEKLQAAFFRNRSLRAQTHSAALSLLPLFRTILLTRYIRPLTRLESTHLSLSDEPLTSLGSLPVELLRRILVELNTSPLSKRQVTKLLAYAGDRETLVGEGMDRESGSREFLREVDCWKYDG